MRLDFKLLNTKEKFLQYMQENLEDMYSLNYDALIDAITSSKDIELELVNINAYQDINNLLDIIDILINDYPYITIKK